MRRLVSLLVLAGTTLALAAPASATSERKLAEDLAGFWTFVLQTPAPQNPFTTDHNRCLELSRHLVAPLLPFAPASTTCVVRPGTRVFIGEGSAECSTAEPPPFHGGNEAQLRACARHVLAGVTEHRLVVDDRIVPVHLVETRVLSVNIPPDNILGVPAQPALSVARGWVALLPPMAIGTHHLSYSFAVTLEGTHLSNTVHITIIVKASDRGRSSSITAPHRS
jgi:hypothetical protein